MISVINLLPKGNKHQLQQRSNTNRIIQKLNIRLLKIKKLLPISHRNKLKESKELAAYRNRAMKLLRQYRNPKLFRLIKNILEKLYRQMENSRKRIQPAREAVRE